jgi:CDP-diglyceride synthetase
LSVLIVVEVLVETYTFSLPVELIIVPTVTLIAMMGAVAEMREEHKPVAKILGNVQALVGFVLIAIVVRRAAIDPEHSFVAALLSSLIVVVLSLATWPYICFLRLVFAYEDMLWRVGWKKNVSKVFKHFAAFRVLRYLQYRSTAVAPFIRRNAFKLNDVVDRNSLEVLLDEDRSRASQYSE